MPRKSLGYRTPLEYCKQLFTLTFEVCCTSKLNSLSYAHIVIDGGNITATGGNGGAGIGANKERSVGDIMINGGTVTANGGYQAAGIGCGYNQNQGTSCGDISFYGGNVTVYGSIQTDSNSFIYIGDDNRGSTIFATSSSPFVYPVPATP